MNTKYTELLTVVFVDQIGRLLIGATPSEPAPAGKFQVIAPAIIDLVQGQAPGSMGIRVVPLCFPDIQKDGNHRATFTFNESSVTITDVGVDDSILDLYRRTLSPPPAIITPPTASVIPATTIPASPTAKQLFD